MQSRLPAVAAGLVAVLLLGAACSNVTPAPPAKTLTVLAGSELKDLEPLLPDLEKATGYRLSMTYVGSLDGAERIVNGDRSQLAWFSSGKYLLGLRQDHRLPAAAVHRHDTDRLLANGRFLEERFGKESGGLTLPPQK
jgi:ABC-type molybdate transport system substrate-binding protein